jgi:drug/metabolite transporter (DMT)-like permease
MKMAATDYPPWAYRLLLVVATVIWGLGFGIGKYAIEAIGATWFTCIRFIGSGIVLLIVLFPHFRKHINRKLLVAGIIIGTASFFGFWTQFVGLGLTTPSKNAFLSTCYCLTVPFIWWAISRKRPSKRICTAAAICTVGIGLVSLQGGFTISLGDAMSIVSAFAYGIEIVAIGFMMRDNDVFTVTVVQQLTAGVLAGLFALAAEPIPSPEQFSDLQLVGSLAYVTLLSAAFGAVAQNVAQAHVPPSEAGILCSLESVFCAIFSVLLFGEVLTAQTVVGFVLIFGAIMLAQRQGV